MKKLRYVMPILGLSAIASSMIPLVSCNKGSNFDGQVTEAEWKTAISFLLCQEQELPCWNSSTDDVIIQRTFKGTDVLVDSLKNIVYDAGNYKAELDCYENVEKTMDVTQYSKVVGNFNYNADVDHEQEDKLSRISIDYLYTDKAIDSIFLLLENLYLHKKDFIFEPSEKTYSFTGEITDSKGNKYDVSVWIAFDQNKHISYFQTLFNVVDAGSTEVDRQVYIKLNFNYGKQSLEFPQEFNERVALHYHSNQSGSISFKNIQPNDEGHIINFIIPEDNINYLKASTGSEPAAMFAYDSLALIVNGDYLLYPAHYTIQDKSTIKFDQPLKKGDVVNFWFKGSTGVNPNTTYTFAFSK